MAERAGRGSLNGRWEPRSDDWRPVRRRRGVRARLHPGDRSPDASSKRGCVTRNGDPMSAKGGCAAQWRGGAAPQTFRCHPRQLVFGPKLPSPRGATKIEINPMNESIETRPRNLNQAPHCGAKTRAGGSCRRPALHGRRRCRLHGGLSPGAPRGSKNGNYKTGDWTAEAIEERKWLRFLVRSLTKSETTR
jgi:hypothetical protein